MMTTKWNIVTLVGGISSTSINRRLYSEMLKHVTGNLEFHPFDIATLPFFTQDQENNMPPVVKSLKEMVKQSDAVLFITPEYNRSIPGVLKNAIDWGSRPYGNNVWADKPAAIMGASIGAIGTFGAQQHLRNVCSFVNLHVMSQPEFYFNVSTGMDENGLKKSSVKFLQQFLVSFEEWITRFKITHK